MGLKRAQRKQLSADRKWIRRPRRTGRSEDWEREKDEIRKKIVLIHGRMRTSTFTQLQTHNWVFVWSLWVFNFLALAIGIFVVYKQQRIGVCSALCQPLCIGGFLWVKLWKCLPNAISPIHCKYSCSIKSLDFFAMRCSILLKCRNHRRPESHETCDLCTIPMREVAKQGFEEFLSFSAIEACSEWERSIFVYL